MASAGDCSTISTGRSGPARGRSRPLAPLVAIPTDPREEFDAEARTVVAGRRGPRGGGDRGDRLRRDPQGRRRHAGTAPVGVRLSDEARGHTAEAGALADPDV